MEIFKIVLLILLVICAVSVSFTKNMLSSIIIYMSYSLVMAMIWVILQSPDLAITEAAVGAGITSLLFFVTLKKIRMMQAEDNHQDTEIGSNPISDSGEDAHDDTATESDSAVCSDNTRTDKKDGVN